MEREEARACLKGVGCCLGVIIGIAALPFAGLWLFSLIHNLLLNHKSLLDIGLIFVAIFSPAGLTVIGIIALLSYLIYCAFIKK